MKALNHVIWHIFPAVRARTYYWVFAITFFGTLYFACGHIPPIQTDMARKKQNEAGPAEEIPPGCSILGVQSSFAASNRDPTMEPTIAPAIPIPKKRKERFYATINVESLEQENCYKESGQKSEGESAASPMSSSRNHRNPHSGPRTGGSRLSGLELSAANHLVVSTERTVFRVCHPQPLVASS